LYALHHVVVWRIGFQFFFAIRYVRALSKALHAMGGGYDGERRVCCGVVRCQRRTQTAEWSWLSCGPWWVLDAEAGESLAGGF
jgi:hypothetical protein